MYDLYFKQNLITVGFNYVKLMSHKIQRNLLEFRYELTIQLDAHNVKQAHFTVADLFLREKNSAHMRGVVLMI